MEDIGVSYLSYLSLCPTESTGFPLYLMAVSFAGFTLPKVHALLSLNITPHPTQVIDMVCTPVVGLDTVKSFILDSSYLCNSGSGNFGTNTIMKVFSHRYDSLNHKYKYQFDMNLL
jgi:hypothetical protein